jgi:hypothetical protein
MRGKPDVGEIPFDARREAVDANVKCIRDCLQEGLALARIAGDKDYLPGIQEPRGHIRRLKRADFAHRQLLSTAELQFVIGAVAIEEHRAEAVSPPDFVYQPTKVANRDCGRTSRRFSGEIKATRPPMKTRVARVNGGNTTAPEPCILAHTRRNFLLVG